MIYVGSNWGGSRSTGVVEMKKMPGGELHPTISDDDLGAQSYIITADTCSSDDLFAILLTHNALKRNDPGKPIDLRIGYVPYARQDRVGAEGEALSIEAFADFINMMRFRKVEIFDPHSDVTAALIKNAVVHSQVDLFREWMVKDSEFESWAINPEDWYLVAPDTGAVKKTNQLAKTLGFGGVVYADKQRDTRTGKITGTIISRASVDGEDVKLDDLSGCKFIVVDDICDGGYTFIQLAAALQDAFQPSDLRLFVTHGIFSKGTQPLIDAGYSRLYCTNAYRIDQHNVQSGWHNEKEIAAADLIIFRAVQTI